MADTKPLIIGEDNPYGGGDDFALYPHPAGCAGQRLCCLVLGMRRISYLEAFARTNLVQGRWSIRAARERAADIAANQPGRRLILCGSKVATAFGRVFVPFAVSDDGRILTLPHPSGRNRMWQEPGSIERARAAVAKLAPEIADLIGKADKNG